MTADWRRVCRSCDNPPVPGRAWCSKHLRLARLGIPTDVEHIPKLREGSAPATVAPFPFWPKTTP